MVSGRRLPVSLIVACSVNRVIGKQEFHEPIPNRHTIVVTSTLKRPTRAEAVGYRWLGVQVALTLKQALQFANSDSQYRDCSRIFIGGGENLYKEAMTANVAESCYVSRLHQVINDGDRLFPKWTMQFTSLVFSAKTNGGGRTR
ncbi:unnamed protein product [Peronospora destructor]|uniref:dihydrofolate reductase n=1 Tax=Peronospora destructor TaxID=86335 RepID=A0AAV0UGV5_9STRA|nr:unnamed protein product [Peronospora destructor]